MIDVSVYYASLTRPSVDHVDRVAPKIVANGAPLRNIAPCGSCHGGLDEKAGSPWLEDQAAAYIRAQLLDFRSSARRNDISEQMRNIARQMTDQEVDDAAQYYGSTSAKWHLTSEIRCRIAACGVRHDEACSIAAIVSRIDESGG